MTKVEKILGITQSDLKRLQEVVRHSNSFAFEYVKTFHNLYKINKHVQPILESAEHIRRISSPLQSQILKLQHKPFPTIDILNSKIFNHIEYSNIHTRIKEITTLLNSIEPELFSEAYKDIANTYFEGEENSDLENKVNEIENKIANTKHGRLSLEFYISLILTLIMYFLQEDSSNKTEARVMEKLERIQYELMQKHEDIATIDSNSSYYISLYSVNVRDGNSTKSNILDILYPCQKVKLVKQSEKWLRIEYYDYVENEYKQGWVFKKHLRIVNKKIPKKYIRP